MRPSAAPFLSLSPLSWRPLAAFAASAVALLVMVHPLQGQEPGERIMLTPERLVDLTVNNSYQVRFLNMGLDQTRLRLRAERARLRSSVSVDVSAPTFQSVSASQWNSSLGRNEIVSENSRRWEAQLSIRQPVILFGYPTNGYLSLNNRVYRYSQIETDGDRDLTYYNRYFIRYTQPLFQPNGLKNSLEGAELDLESSEIDFQEDMMDLVDDVFDDYLDLFEVSYREKLQQGYVASLERALGVAQQAAGTDPSRAIEPDQIRVELANARERLQSSQSRFRLEISRLKTNLDLPESTEVLIDPVIEVRPVQVDAEQAVRFATELTPRLRQLAISRREGEIRFQETQGRGGFRVDLEFTYGREMRDPFLRELWSEPRNTYTVDVNASIPIWDWGERGARIEAERINLRRTELRIEQAEAKMISDVQNEIRNVEELQERVLAMDENLALATDISLQSLARYQAGSIGALDLLQSLRREADTANNFLDAYVSWRESIQRLQELTYYDFELELPVLQRFGIPVSTAERDGSATPQE